MRDSQGRGIKNAKAVIPELIKRSFFAREGIKLFLTKAN